MLCYILLIDQLSVSFYLKQNLNAGLGGSIGGIFTRSPTGASDTRASLKALHPKTPCKDLWGKFRKDALKADLLNGESQSIRFVNSTSLCADIQTSSVDTFLDERDVDRYKNFEIKLNDCVFFSPLKQ